MRKKTGLYKGIPSRVFRLTLTVLTLIFLLTSISTAFSEEEPWIAVIEKNGNSVYFADHNENLTEGGWILLSGGNEIQLPRPFNITYNGTDNFTSSGAELELKSDASGNNTEITLTYPYTTHPFYTNKDKIKMDYKGPEVFGRQKVSIYLVDGLDLYSLDEAFRNVRDENSVSFKDVFDNSTNSTTLVTSVALDKNGDLPSSLTLDPLSAGSYGILVMLEGDENEKSRSERKVLSATCFEVLEYELKIKSPNKLEEHNNLDIDLDLKKVPTGNYTYGALLIREDAYRAEMNVSSNGTIAGSSMFVNGIDIINEFDINSTNYRSKLNKDELTTEIQTLIGEGNGTISIGEENQKSLSLTTFDLPPGDYLLFAGAYEKGKGLIGISQEEISIGKVKKTTGSNKNQESNVNLPVENQNPSKPQSASMLDAPGLPGLEDLEPQMRGEILKATEVIKNPPKLASFLAGFIATLLIGIIVMKRRQ
ncbi:TIGR04279 domain-containing protein [Methanosarcina hadiensis]|uniref:TIGR04279 domain-containing protein n=1 Tax=Methanosarcina hadiensis TaxID=3078083 RepID=UPI0039773FBD